MSNTAPQFPIIAQWNLTGKYLDDDGNTTRLRVEKYADGTGNVFNVLPDREVKWFVDGLSFEHEPSAYISDTMFYNVQRVL